MKAPTTRHKSHPNNARLIRIVEQRGMSEQRIAELASAKPTTVRSWLQGQRQMPDYRMELFEMRLDALAGPRKRSA